MEDNKTKYIESSLAAFRAIKSFVFQKGAYPGNFDNGTWKEEDYDDPGYRRVMREDFDNYLRLLTIIRKQYAQALCDAVPHIESEYDHLVIDSRNLDQAVKLFFSPRSRYGILYCGLSSFDRFCFGYIAVMHILRISLRTRFLLDNSLSVDCSRRASNATLALNSAVCLRLVVFPICVQSY